MDALTLLRAYLAGDEQAIMSRAHVEAVIAEIENYKVIVGSLPEALIEAKRQRDEARAALAAERERAEFYHAGQHTYQDRLEDAEAELAAERERKKSYMQGEITEYERAEKAEKRVSKLREALVRADVQLRRLDYEGELLAAIDAVLKETEK
jgi:hypothetical protein